jgi:two-component sensor histidine kinase
VIHQNLYHASSLSRVRADVLVEEIVRQVLVRALGPQSRIRVDYQLEPTTLYPDQALPLAMLANEAVTNALKYVGQPDKGDPWIEVRLAAAPEDGRVALRVANSAGARLAEVAEYEGQGLGQQLMRAFLTQIGGEMQIEEEDDRYWLEVRFAVAEFEAAEAAEAAQ